MCVYIWCIWIPLILLKTENNKKIFSGYYSLMKLLCICLITLFGHEQCKRRWIKKKKKKRANAGE